MSTADETVPALAPPHPDHHLMARVRAALEHWSTHPAAQTPTSSILGTGAIAAVENEISVHHNNIPAMFLGSATHALRVAMTAVGVAAGDDVLLPALDWPASYAAALSIGAHPVAVAVDPTTLTIDPIACAAAVTLRTRAVIACHLHGVCADIPALRTTLPELPVIEDCAAAQGSSLDGRRAGTMGDVAVFSFGPGKRIDAGEAGALLARDPRTHRRALAACAHPLRAILFGLEVDPSAMIIRPHPLAAILALDALAQWDPAADELAHRRLADALSGDPELTLVGHDSRRINAGPTVPVLIVGRNPTAAGKTGAVVLPGAPDRETIRDLADRVRLIPAGSRRTGYAQSTDGRSEGGAGGEQRLRRPPVDLGRQTRSSIVAKIRRRR